MIYQLVLIIILVLSVFSDSGYPAGFLVYNQDAASAGMGNSFTAIADNASAVFYNPAGMNQLDGTQIRSGFQLVFPDTSFRGADSGHKTDMHEDISTLVTGYITHKISDRISVGGGISTPFGLVTEWPDNWEGANVSTYSDLRTFFVNPAISVQVHPRLSLAAGIDYVYSDFKIRRRLDLNNGVCTAMTAATNPVIGTAVVDALGNWNYDVLGTSARTTNPTNTGSNGTGFWCSPSKAVRITSPLGGAASSNISFK